MTPDVLRGHSQIQVEPAGNERARRIVAQIRGMLKSTREMLDEVGSLADAVFVVRRSDVTQKAIHETLKSYKELEHDQFNIRQDAAESHLRTLRRAGELLMACAKHRGGRPATPSIVERVDHQPPTLRQLGISVQESHRWQRIARIPDEQFEEFIYTYRNLRRELTVTAALALSRPVDPDTSAERDGVDKLGADRGATARGEYLRSRQYLASLISVDPRALAADLKIAERRQALAEFNQIQQWTIAFTTALKRA
ncbi:hypothetical protein Athai_13540 [Actinocatenispora thailandica]|uniref:Uncharacterized protein n=1 Tax=Actinocatenispora thailandica TaxID=227318 RepID=A0A7R7DLN1_9ACTN|nr:hypothetical protein [Actinocatenispora thailandica]BCJ33851.1 hypothetical protein Athai_13540 [Actinocatenispora thailandica]